MLCACESVDMLYGAHESVDMLCACESVDMLWACESVDMLCACESVGHVSQLTCCSCVHVSQSTIKIITLLSYTVM